MTYPFYLLGALTPGACVDGAESPADFPLDVQARKQAMAFRKRPQPSSRRSVWPPLGDGAGIQMFLTHNGQNMTICRTDNATQVKELFAYG